MMDDVLLSAVRLKIVAELLTAEWISFTALRAVTETTHGNLGAHAAKLVAAGYVREEKQFAGRRPMTRYRLSAAGRRAFYAHLEAMQRISDAASAFRARKSA
jgi:DNA-binding transcriptional ArsR family regulator